MTELRIVRSRRKTLALQVLPTGEIVARAQRTRWGSCSARGSLSFNCLLMLAPPEMREYVAVHELCHRKQMNHSAAFWREVALWLPDYAAQRAWLREHGPALLGRLPKT